MLTFVKNAKVYSKFLEERVVQASTSKVVRKAMESTRTVLYVIETFIWMGLPVPEEAVVQMWILYALVTTTLPTMELVRSVLKER
jgi:hypothetical protein